MSQINPFTGAVSQTPQLQRLQSSDKTQQLRRAQNRSRNSGLAGEDLEHQVENPDAIVSVHDDDEQHPDQQKKKRPPKPPLSAPSEQNSSSHLDLTA